MATRHRVYKSPKIHFRYNEIFTQCGVLSSRFPERVNDDFSKTTCGTCIRNKTVHRPNDHERMLRLRFKEKRKLENDLK